MRGMCLDGRGDGVLVWWCAADAIKAPRQPADNRQTFPPAECAALRAPAVHPGDPMRCSAQWVYNHVRCVLGWSQGGRLGVAVSLEGAMTDLWGKKRLAFCSGRCSAGLLSLRSDDMQGGDGDLQGKQ